MTELEEVVRTALIEKSIEERLAKISENPEKINELTTRAGEVCMDYIITNDPELAEDSEEEKEEVKQICYGMIAPMMATIMSDTKTLKGMVHSSAQKEWRSYEQAMQEKQRIIEELRASGEVAEELLKEYETELQERLVEETKLNDIVIRKLTGIAEAYDVERATSQESRDSVCREIFPTAEDYKRHVQNKYEIEKKFFQRSQSILSRDGMIGQDKAAEARMILTYMGTDVFSDFLMELLEDNIARIYA